MKFSVIIPVFNAEQYLKECIESVINQTYNFIENINIILVNDGSTDSSHTICLYYTELYPKNIKYIKTKNTGPSNARNTGIKNVDKNTDYVIFLDSDDKLELNAIEQINHFFDINNNVKIAVLPVYYFENGKGQNRLNRRFNQGTRVIDIFKEYSSPQFYIGGVILDYNLLNVQDELFDTTLSFWEDALFINKLILKEGNYGVISNTIYWYRKRKTKDSLVDISWRKKSRYHDLINNGYLAIINYSQKLYGYIHPYVQYLIVYHLKLFAFPRNSDVLMQVLNKSEVDSFIILVKKLLSFIDDKYILEQDTLNTYKEFLLFIKNDKFTPIEDINKIDKNNCIKITRYKLSGLYLVLEGFFSDEYYIFKKGDKILIKIFNKYITSLYKTINNQLKIWGITIRDYSESGFVIKIPIWYLCFQFAIKIDEKIILLEKTNLIKIFLKSLNLKQTLKKLLRKT